ncbi:MAG: flagellar M-ring protein FliF [Acidobacteria bacterium]|nr:flagellar M-ring protein FliF [Acidobacteriota bacterium]
MNPEQWSAHIKRLAATLSPRQIATLAAAFIGVVGVVVGSAYWINTPTYSVLFADIDPESAQAVITRLKGDKVPYVLDQGGRTIRVAASRVDELRLQYASAGTAAGGRIGFEIFDRTAFGTTEFLEHVNYRRALEGELARTIGTIGEVAGARVHIALPKESLFAAEAQPAKASVVLKLRNNRPLASATIAAITNLVAASVESLRPEAVVVVDTFGRSLTQESDQSDTASGMQLDRQRRIEHDLVAKVTSLLEPVVGEGHVRVNVTARLNEDAEEETEERWDPETVVRSRQSSTDSGSSPLVQGVAGARANAPPNASTALPPAPPAQAPQTASRTTETTNYEVSRVTRHRISPRGRIARLSVAVILDDDRTSAAGSDGRVQVTAKPRSPDDLQRIHNLVASAVGIDADRGDELTVENIAFGETPVEEAPALPWWQKLATPIAGGASLVDALRIAAILGLAALAFLLVLRPMARRALQLPPAVEISSTSLPTAPPRQVKTIADLEGEIEAELDAGAAARAEGRRLPVLTRRIAKVAEEEPEHVARLVRTWLSEEER